jgi:iron complex outermembrane receptor protein
MQAKKQAIAVAVATAVASPAIAQDTFDEITVTATKRAVNIQDVPIAVTSVSGDDLVKMQVNDILSLEQAIPGLTVASYGNNPQAVIRGAGTAGTTDIAVPIYHNGMYLPTYGQALAGYIDIERIEALRGPQGTLFGRNTYGGLINVITKKPELDDMDFGASVSVGDYSLRKIEGFLNVPFSDTVGMRLTLADEQRDPYVENIINEDAGLKDSDYTYGRAQLMFLPTDSLSVNLTVAYWKDTANGNLNYAYKGAGIPLDANDSTKINAINGVLDPRMGLYSGINCPDGDRPGGRSQAGNVCDGDISALVIDDPFIVDFNTAPIRELEETSVYLNVNWELENHNLTVNAAHFDYSMIQLSDADFSRNAGWFDGDYAESKSQQIDVTFSSTGDGRLQYTVGAYMFDDQDDSNVRAYQFASFEESWSGYAGATPTTPSWAYWNSEGRGGTKSTAIYGQTEYSLTDKLHLTTGVRYTKDDRSSQRSNSLPFDPAARLGDLPTYTYGDNAPQVGDDDNVDYRVGLAYDVGDQAMVYGSFATAYIAGATDAVNQNLLEPQTNETFELGVKSTLLDGAMTLNASVYNAQYEGLNTTKFVIQGNTGVAVAVQVPGGSIQSRGLEVEGVWYPSEALAIDFGITFEDSQYDEFIVGAGNLIWNGEAPIGSEVIAGEAVYVMDGKQTAYSPDFTLGLGISYDISLGDNGILRPYAHAYFNSGYMTNRAPVFFGEQDSFTKLNLSLGWESANGQYTAKLWMNNATDELIQTYTEIYSRARVAYDYQAPRSWGLRFGYNF